MSVRSSGFRETRDGRKEENLELRRVWPPSDDGAERGMAALAALISIFSTFLAFSALHSMLLPNGEYGLIGGRITHATEF